ncbi:MAG: sensor diguanylate cyclase and phosphodiesterase, partial [Proteobacteria bacterium]|nr:sensor diguanylate cyclase and phosphodiesterase [Pseudomonadota bacterium]
MTYTASLKQVMKNVEGEQPLILVGEHQQGRLAWLQTALESDGYRCLFIDSGAALARELVERRSKCEPPILLIVDPTLPDCNSEVLGHAVASDIGILVLADNDTDDGGADVLARNISLQVEGTILAPWPSRLADLPALVHLSVQLGLERRRRNDQEAQLLDELAERKVMEARLKYLVAHDELTGLANRSSLERKLQVALRRCEKASQCGALLYLDLDRFNLINDLEGHGIGDRLLVEVVGLIHANLDPGHIAARIGADEFCIFIGNIGHDTAGSIAERLRRALDGFHFLAARDNYRISASIGVVMLEPGNGSRHPREVITRAHQACYVAKSNGRNRVHFYNEKDLDVY